MDTSAWVALRDEDDENHADAVDGWRSVVQARVPLLSTYDIFAEALILLRRRVHLKASVEFGQAFLTSPALRRLEVEPSVRERAWEFFQRQNDQVLSFVDCLSFAHMERHGLRQAFAFDEDFLAAGFALFPRSPLV